MPKEWSLRGFLNRGENFKIFFGKNNRKMLISELYRKIGNNKKISIFRDISKRRANLIQSKKVVPFFSKNIEK